LNFFLNFFFIFDLQRPLSIATHKKAQLQGQHKHAMSPRNPLQQLDLNDMRALPRLVDLFCYETMTAPQDLRPLVPPPNPASEQTCFLLEHSDPLLCQHGLWPEHDADFTTPDNRPTATNLSPHTLRPPRAPLAGSFKLVRRKLSFVRPPQTMAPPPLELAPSPSADDKHAAHKAFHALCLSSQ